MKSKTNKLREEAKQLISYITEGLFDERDPEYKKDVRHVCSVLKEIRETAIQAEKKKWKQEALNKEQRKFK